MTTDGGQTAWTDLTGDLYDPMQSQSAGNLYAVRFVPGSPDRLFIGTTGGIFVMAMNAPGFWNQLHPSDAALGLPNVIVKRLVYDAPGDNLFVGSIGRGAWAITQPTQINLPPAASCVTSVEKVADQACSATLTVTDVDDGSIDPEGANMNPTLSVTGPLPLGEGVVTLTLNDGDNNETCTSDYSVVDKTPPVFVDTDLAPLVIPRCDFSNQNVVLEFPVAIDNCSSSSEVTVIGTVAQSTNPAFPPGALLTDPNVALPPGTYTVEWIAVDADLNQTPDPLVQTISVQPALFAGQSLFVNTGSTVRIAGSQALGSVANAGGGVTAIGNDAYVGDVRSVANVSIGDRAIAGNVVSAGSVTVGFGAQLPPVQQFTPVSLPAPLDLAGVPAPSGGPPVTLGSTPLQPGSYGQTTVNSGEVLTLGAGVYSFLSLTLNDSAIVTASDDTVLYVGTSQQWQSSFRTTTGTLAHVTAGYFGTDLQMSADFAGTLVAPNATVHMGTSNAQAFSGIVHAATIVLENDADFTCDPTACASSLCGGPVDACSNGQKDPGEEGVDCGGSCPNACSTACSAATYEAETMTQSTGGAYYAQGSQVPTGWNIWSDGYVSTQHVFTPGPAQITVRALGEQALGVLPHMVVSVGGTTVGDATVVTGTFADYTFAFMASGGQKEVRVTFDNDAYQPPQDRNLIVDSVTVDCAPVFTMVNGSVSMEAEHFHGTTQNGSADRWSVQGASQASGAACMSIGPDSGDIWTSNVQSTAPRLDFNVSFDTSGTFYLHVRADGANGAGDSCWGGADAYLNTSHFDFADNPNTWGWITRTLPIATPGLHTVRLWAREDGLRADKIVINTSATPPVGGGPPESTQQ